MLDLNLCKAPGLYFGNFGLESGQGSAPLFWPFWASMCARLWAFIWQFLGLKLGRAPGLYFGNFGPESGQGLGLCLGYFGLKFVQGYTDLNFGRFGPESGQGSRLLLSSFWA